MQLGCEEGDVYLSLLSLLAVGIGIGVGSTWSRDEPGVELAVGTAAHVGIARRDGVVLGGEVELNRITGSGIDRIRRERQSVAGPNRDLVDRASCKNSREEVKERGLGKMHLDNECAKK